MEEALLAGILGNANDHGMEYLILYNILINRDNVNFDLANLTDEEIRLNFRFERDDLPRLARLLTIPDEIVTETGNRISDDLLYAKTKLKLAEETSDLQSEGEEVIKRRKRKLPPRYIESECDDSDSESVEQSTLARPPRILKRPTILANEIEEQKTVAINTPASETSLFSLEASTLTAATPKRTITTPTASSFATNTDFQRKLIDQLGTIIEQNNEILSILKNQNNFSGQYRRSGNLLASLPVTLPVTTLEELAKLEIHIKDNKQNQDNLVLYLSSLDRTSSVSATNSILKCCLSYGIAKNFSFLGSRQEKKAFKDYEIKKIIVAAVKLAIPSISDKTIEDHIKHWLKRTPKLYSLEEEKIQRKNGI
ncbi:hypothetical protein FQR65_LT19848 [Abscondita terminalis]|nr:hypothetical protein FQR65_LT19848 [Abscondita terminalis]